MMMNNRERILSLLNHNAPDRLPWAGDLDYWYSAEILRGDLPERYRGDGYFQLNHDLGSGFYLQGYSPYQMHHPGITFSEQQDGHRRTRTMHTPAGDLTEIQQYLPVSFSWGYLKHYAETPADLPAFLAFLESLEFTADYTEAERRRSIVGDNGVVLVYAPRSPFMEMVTTYVGITHLVYLLVDEPEQMSRVFAVMERKYDLAAGLALNSPAECIMIPENLSSELVGAAFYKRYLRPYERRWIERIRQAGKYSFVHMDGTLKGLLKQVAETGFDVIEAVTPQPSGDIPMAEAMAMVPGDTILWGGLPGIVFTPSVSEIEFEQHTIDTIRLMASQPRYVLGVADQVPPSGLESRVRRVRELVEECGAYR